MPARIVAPFSGAVNGEIRKGCELGKKPAQSNWMWFPCPMCGESQWKSVRIGDKHIYNPHCLVCGQYRRGASSRVVYERRKKYSREWHRRNRDKYFAKRLELKKEVLTHYGSGDLTCIQCGFEDLRALTIDHINGGGNRHRKEIKTGNFYQWLKRGGFPLGFQTLCANCQFIKKFETDINNPPKLRIKDEV